MNHNQNLNDAQMQAVMHQKGVMMALAGPGSGKTLVITRRIEHLIKYAGIDPLDILVITFTKAAANEMKERFLSLMPAEGKRVTFGTFHAVFFMILKHAYHFEASDIIREEERIRLVQEILRSRKLDDDREAEFASNLLAEISYVKNGRIALTNYYPIHCGKDVFEDVYQAYHQFLKRRRKIDFDDMLVYTYELFSQRKDILLAWQRKYRYILVDEFQDVNQIQYDIVKMLTAREKNLFVVGDDDQSVYRFRGARPEIMLHMAEDYPDAKIVTLSYNYRCPKDVVEFASRIIAHNKERFPKHIEAVKEKEHTITMELFENQREEYAKVVERIRKQTVPLSHTAVLFRTNTQARMLMEQLMEYNIPFIAKDSIPNLYEHWIAGDLFAYIQIAQGSRKRKDFLRIINRPKRYISRESLEEDHVEFTRWQAFYALQPWIGERIEKLGEDMEVIQQMRPFAAVNYIRKAIGYDLFLKEYAKERNIEEESLFEIIDALQESSAPYASCREWFLHIDRYKEELKEAYGKKKNEENAVTLATFHSAKGLEFDLVHIVDVNEGITPYKKAVLPAELEEERRMFYVGITRAREKLHLYSTKKIGNHEKEVSRFLAEGGF